MIKLLNYGKTTKLWKNRFNSQDETLVYLSISQNVATNLMLSRTQIFRKQKENRAKFFEFMFFY